MALFRPAMYLAALALTAQIPPPVGSQTSPSRGLKADVVATVWPAWSTPSFLSKRTPTLAVIRSLTRQLSLANTAWVRNVEPWLVRKIGFHWMRVVVAVLN